MEDKRKVKFEEFDIEFDKDDFKGMDKKDLQECDEILKKIEELI